MTGTTARSGFGSTLEAYVAEVARRVQEVAGDRLVGVWLLGSAALHDYDPVRSDVDVQAVTAERLGRADRDMLVGRLVHEALPNPARGLEFVLYAREDLSHAAGPRLQLNLNTGARMERHVAYEADEEPRFWFTVDVSIARQHGVALLGPPASAVFPEPPRALVVAALLEALDFYTGAGAPEQTLLSACRTWAWAVDGVWRSKGDSARWAMARVAQPEPVERALRLRDGEPADPVTEEEVDPVLRSARAALASVAG
jgi:predicted nucleotidyltransferase